MSIRFDQMMARKSTMNIMSMTKKIGTVTLMQPRGTLMMTAPGGVKKLEVGCATAYQQQQP